LYHHVAALSVVIEFADPINHCHIFKSTAIFWRGCASLDSENNPTFADLWRRKYPFDRILPGDHQSLLSFRFSRLVVGIGSQCSDAF